MRLVAQIAFILIPVEIVAAFASPGVEALVALPFMTSFTALPVLWYLIFTMPRELVDRHAAATAARGVPGSPANTRGLGLGGVLPRFGF